MSNIVLYAHKISTPCRVVMMVGEAIGVHFNIQEIDLMKREHMTPESLKMNPFHTIPWINDNGFTLVDSHAIVTYLVDKYAKNDTLYPKDHQKRALVDQFLHFDSSVLFATSKSILRPIYHGVKTITEEQIKQVKECFTILDKALEGKEYLVGNTLTLADICCMSTVNTLSAIVTPMDPYPHVKAWMTKCEKTIPGYAKLNLPGHKLLYDTIQSNLHA